MIAFITVTTFGGRELKDFISAIYFLSRFAIAVLAEISNG